MDCVLTTTVMYLYMYMVRVFILYILCVVWFGGQLSCNCKYW